MVQGALVNIPHHIPTALTADTCILDRAGEKEDGHRIIH